MKYEDDELIIDLSSLPWVVDLPFWLLFWVDHLETLACLVWAS